jgi:hypothetical protein
MAIIKQHDIRRTIKALAIGTVALLTMMEPMLGPAAAQNLEVSSSNAPVDASSRTLGCGTATNIGRANMAPLYVDGFLCSAPPPLTDSNTAYTNIKICAPGSKTNCQVIDHVLVDTGSVGLRIASGAVTNNNLLKAMPYIPTSGGQILAICTTFASSQLTFGPVQTADVYIAGKFARNFPLQIVFAPTVTPPDNGCGGLGGSPGNLGGNGVVGLALVGSGSGNFWSCDTDGSNCTLDTSPSTTIPNLVSKLQNDNNGIAVSLNNISTLGSTVPVLGLLIFGVGTQANNTPPEGTIPLLADSSGLINLEIGTNKPTSAIIDSGSFFLSINDPDLPLCADGIFYCPSPVITVSSGVSLGAIQLGLSSYTNTTTTPDFDVTYPLADTDGLFSNAGTAYNDVALASGPNANLGLSFFFGRTIYFVSAGQQSPLGMGPINAIVPQQSVIAAGE